MFVQVLLLMTSLLLLYYGSELALDGAQKIGLYLGLSPLVIGVAIVGMGTSLPEFFVSHFASFRGDQELAIGNLVGSNIANTFLIMGVAGLFSHIYIARREILAHLWLHLVMTLILAAILYGGGLYWWGSALLFIFLGYYLYDTFQEVQKGQSIRIDPINNIAKKKENTPTAMVWGKLFTGFLLLYSGGELLVLSSGNLAVGLGISSFVLAAILVALGTSLPELVMAISVARKGLHTDLIVGNIVGSNIFNIAFVLLTLTPYRMVFDQSFRVEAILLLGGAVFLVGLSRANKNINRFSAGIFLACYLGIISFWIYAL